MNKEINMAHVFGFLAVSVFLFALSEIVFHSSYHGDEGFYLAQAQNMVRDGSYLIRPSSVPMGDFEATCRGLCHPPLNAFLLAVGMRLTGMGLVGAELVVCLNFVVFLFAVYLFCSVYNRHAAKWATLLAGLSPTVWRSFGSFECEPFITTFGFVALYFAVSGCRNRCRSRLIAGGVFLGLTFLFKLWLAAFFFTGTGLLMLMEARGQVKPLRETVFSGMLVLIPAALIALSHLLLIAVASPGDLAFWLSHVYFRSEKVSAEGVPSCWIHPFWYYPVIIYRDHFFLIPAFFLTGTGHLKQFLIRYRMPIVLMGNAMIVIGLLSCIPVKEPLYIFSSVIALYIFAGWRLYDFAERQTAAYQSQGSFALSVLIPMGLAVMIVVLFLLGIKRDDISGSFVVAHTLVMLAATILAAARRIRNHRCPKVVATVIFAAFLCSAGYKICNRDTFYLHVAKFIEPFLEDAPAGHISFVSPRFKSVQVFLNHRGWYVHTLPLEQKPAEMLSDPRYADIRVFVFFDDLLTDAETGSFIQWLELNTGEKTGDFLELYPKTEKNIRIFVFDRNIQQEESHTVFTELPRK